ncbi:MAG: hypothetical protein U5L00_02420 [Desulfovermiculus sp.]|nr:hypothetical protein [Desulfovermiculus sp.]
MRTVLDKRRTWTCTGLLLALGLLMGVWTGTGICEDMVERPDPIAGKETEISLLSTRIEKIQKDIRFEEAWAKQLDAAREKLLQVRNANSELGQMIKLIGNAVSGGGVDSLIQEKIARVNRLLKPYFRVDGKGNLQWGMAIQLAGIQAQFVPGGMTALTPQAALTTLEEWRANNRAKLEANRSQVQDLQQHQRVLEVELRRLRTKFTANETEEAGGGIDDLRAQVKDLSQRLAQVEKLAAKYSAQAEEVETELHELKYELEFRQANAQQALYDADRFSESFSYCETVRLDFKIGYVTNLAARISMLVQELKAEFQRYREAGSTAKGMAEMMCENANRAREATLIEGGTLELWVKEASADLAELANRKKSLEQKLRPLGNTRAVLERQVKDLRSYEVHSAVCAAVASKLSECAKDMTRIREIQQIQKSMNMIQAALGQSRQWLSGLVEDVRTRLRHLSHNTGSDPEMGTRIEQLRERLQSVSDTLSKTGAAPVIPHVPSISCHRYDNYNLDAAGQRLPELQSALAAGNAALAEADGALLLVNDALAEGSLSQNLKRGQGCYDQLVKIADSMSPSVMFEDAADRAKALLDSYTNPIQHQKVAEDFCSQAREQWESMNTQVGRLEKVEKLVQGSLRAADGLADSCPEVKNPENIAKLYAKAKQFTVRMGADVVVMLRRDGMRIEEKLKLAAEARSDVLSEAASIHEKIEQLHQRMLPLAENVSRNDPAAAHVDNLRFTLRDARLLYGKIQKTPECQVPAGNGLIARAEKAYTGALTVLRGYESLPARAKACIEAGESHQDMHDEAMAAIEACDLEKASGLLQTLPDGPGKSSVQEAYDTAMDLQRELKELVNVRARKKFDACEYEVAMSLLERALDRAQCQSDRERIAKTLEATRKRLKEQKALKKLVNTEAREKFDEGDYDGALDLLKQALERARCQWERDKIAKSIKAVRNKQSKSQLSRSTSDEHSQVKAPGSCNDQGMKVLYSLIDPPPYSGISSICRDTSNRIWLQTGGGMEVIKQIVKGSNNSQTGCYDGSRVVTKSRTYDGRLCVP